MIYLIIIRVIIVIIKIMQIIEKVKAKEDIAGRLIHLSKYFEK